MAREQYQSVRGMRDILPADQPRYQQIIQTFEGLALAAGYGRIETPMVEERAVFERVGCAHGSLDAVNRTIAN